MNLAQALILHVYSEIRIEKENKTGSQYVHVATEVIMRDEHSERGVQKAP